MTTLVFEELGKVASHVVEVRRLLVAGFTGRDSEAVARHLGELESEGVPVPDSTPTLYVLAPELVKQTPVVVVAGSKTSGEVEPVLVVAANGRRLLALGSDHTDRELEREDIAASKAACTKVVSTACVPLDAVSEEDWDLIALESRVDGGSAYQSGTLAELLRPGDLLERLGPELLGLQEGDVLFLGTVPTLEGIRSSSSFSASMSLAASGWKVELSYAVADMSSANRAPLRKPEIEFSAVEGFDWAKVEGIPGQLQRILASDPATAVATRMLRFEPGCDTSAFGVLRHDFWEEVYILSGELHDLSLDRVFGAGTYACRPPGMPHGPWRSEPGCVTFEVRYPAI